MLIFVLLPELLQGLLLDLLYLSFILDIFSQSELCFRAATTLSEVDGRQVAGVCIVLRSWYECLCRSP